MTQASLALSLTLIGYAGHGLPGVLIKMVL